MTPKLNTIWHCMSYMLLSQGVTQEEIDKMEMSFMKGAESTPDEPESTQNGIPTQYTTAYLSGAIISGYVKE